LINPFSFARYSIILTRMPFGNETAAVATATQAEAMATPAESSCKTLKLCAITRNHTTGKMQVGLMDQATQKSYFLCAGDKVDGMELKEADYVGEKALLKMGDTEMWLAMKASAMDAQVVVRNPFGLQNAMPQPPPTPDEAEPKADMAMSSGEAEPAAASLQKRLISAQMDLIRARGAKGPPLPMALTPAMDDQLVKEGVLAPAE